MGAVLLAIGLVAYNSAANRWRAFHGSAYVPLNLMLTGSVLVIGFWVFDLERADVGARWASAWIGLAIAVGAMVPVYALLLSGRGRRVLRDERLAGVRGWHAVFMLVVRIPVGTAATEEIVFRGVLLGSMLSSGETVAVIGSSIAFGLWHVVPTMDLARANRLPALLVVPAGVLFTGAAGAFLAWLRLESDSVAAPVVLHAVINSMSAGAALIALARNEHRA